MAFLLRQNFIVQFHCDPPASAEITRVQCLFMRYSETLVFIYMMFKTLNSIILVDAENVHCSYIHYAPQSLHFSDVANTSRYK